MGRISLFCLALNLNLLAVCNREIGLNALFTVPNHNNASIEAHSSESKSKSKIAKSSSVWIGEVVPVKGTIPIRVRCRKNLGGTKSEFCRHALCGIIRQYMGIGSQCPKTLVNDSLVSAKIPASAVITRIGIKAVLDDGRIDFGSRYNIANESRS